MKPKHGGIQRQHPVNQYHNTFQLNAKWTKKESDFQEEAEEFAAVQSISAPLVRTDLEITVKINHFVFIQFCAIYL